MSKMATKNVPLTPMERPRAIRSDPQRPAGDCDPLSVEPRDDRRVSSSKAFDCPRVDEATIWAKTMPLPFSGGDRYFLSLQVIKSSDICFRGISLNF
jgi:hypothetical protein